MTTPQHLTADVLVLDAMGVIFQAADDVQELLIPFARDNGSDASDAQITQLYLRASRGEIDAAEFWSSIGLSDSCQEEYLQRHRLTDGLIEFLENRPAQIESIWCLSNDVSEWSQCLRQMHELQDRFAGFLISGDVGMRKPDPSIYRRLIGEIQRPPQRIVFVDDRVPNLDAAREQGLRTIHFSTSASDLDSVHPAAATFSALAQILS